MKIISTIINQIVAFIGSVEWKIKNPLTAESNLLLQEKLKNDYYIILTRRNNHLSTYTIALANFILTGKFSYWSHSLMNLEDEVNSKLDFRLIEATSVGVAFSTFDAAFNVNSVVLLKPKHITLDEWTLILDKAKSDLGKPYDSLYDLSRDNALSCVELVRNALKASPNYEQNFANFEKLITKSKNLTPQMFYDCLDFEVVYEIRN